MKVNKAVSGGGPAVVGAAVGALVHVPHCRGQFVSRIDLSDSTRHCGLVISLRAPRQDSFLAEIELDDNYQ